MLRGADAAGGCASEGVAAHLSRSARASGGAAAYGSWWAGGCCCTDRCKPPSRCACVLLGRSMSGSIPCARSPSRMRSAVSKSLARFARTQSSRISSSSSALGRSTGGAAAGSGGALAPSGGPVGRVHDVCLVSAWYQYVVSLYRGSLASIQPGGSGGGSSSRGRFSPVIAVLAVLVVASSSAGFSAAGAGSAASVLASGAGAASGAASVAGSASAAAGGGSSVDIESASIAPSRRRAMARTTGGTSSGRSQRVYLLTGESPV